METYILDDSDDMWQHFAKLIGNVSWPAGKYLANEMLGGRVSDWERVIILMDDDQLVGFCAVVREDIVKGTGYSPFIGFVFVSEDYRGRHLSQQLVKLAENQIKQIGFHKAYIVTKHVGLYEKLGYEQIDTSVDQLGRKMRILAKQL
ncbi:GNAT family N-acetyltransferase [Lentilactobacillus buchneri]|uniref:GNAT family N-acetyltransferase n=1 Tax=Lentilactobacillus buchneri TaxID=1581 RepID=UPI001291D291|nr:GNAT family N-acetyltransferase [Lentilactobacillus buchneri]MQM59626.1 GNAT family N-acetyltransferase [Lentilactobacillus buchneri]MQM79320.1 GNAT family N-acetyltransferase [Lentilactobacillus buchneri]